MKAATGTEAISLIVPVLNEATQIQGTIESLLGQDASHFTLEFLFVDGGSSDGTREILEQYARAHPSVKLYHNPRQTTPVALNIGLRAACGDYVGILGAHAKYPRDYIRICWEELHAHNATGCSGRLLTLPANQSLGARLAAWCLGHRFASSGTSVRTHPEGYADTIPFPVIHKQALMDAGGYDETLDRNQDNEMNERLSVNGHRLYLTARTHAVYYARPAIGSLLLHAYNTGKWNGKTVRNRHSGLSIRHFVPLAFLLTLAVLAFVSIVAAVSGLSSFPLLLLLALSVAAHVFMGTIAGIEIALRQRCMAALLLPPVILAFHIAYGVGTAAGLVGAAVIRVENRKGNEVHSLPLGR
jgi:glycosyltransferase involved in cell wall biosynthesis